VSKGHAKSGTKAQKDGWNVKGRKVTGTLH